MSKVKGHNFLSVVGCLLLIGSSQQQVARWEACDRLCGELPMDPSESLSEWMTYRYSPSWREPNVRQIEVILQFSKSSSPQQIEYHPSLRKATWLWPQSVGLHHHHRHHSKWKPSLSVAPIPFPFLSRSDWQNEGRIFPFELQQRFPPFEDSPSNRLSPTPNHNPSTLPGSGQKSGKQIERSGGFSSKESTEDVGGKNTSAATSRMKADGATTATVKSPPKISFGLDEETS